MNLTKYIFLLDYSLEAKLYILLSISCPFSCFIYGTLDFSAGGDGRQMIGSRKKLWGKLISAFASVGLNTEVLMLQPQIHFFPFWEPVSFIAEQKSGISYLKL